jgi:hypothetical protein
VCQCLKQGASTAFVAVGASRSCRLVARPGERREAVPATTVTTRRNETFQPAAGKQIPRRDTGRFRQEPAARRPFRELQAQNGDRWGQPRACPTRPAQRPLVYMDYSRTGRHCKRKGPPGGPGRAWGEGVSRFPVMS